MANLKHKLHTLALCAAALAFFGGQLLAETPKPKVAIVAINDAKADKELFNLARDTFSGSLKSAWGLKVDDSILTKLAFKKGNSPETIKAAGKLLSVNYVCAVGLYGDTGNLQIVAELSDAASGERIAQGDRAINPNFPEKDAVRYSKALAKEMEKALKKKLISDKASALKDLAKR